MGGFLGQIAFPNSVLAQVSCVVGSIIPDVPMACQFTFDCLLKKKALRRVPNWILILAELSHSAILWPVIGIIGFLFCSDPWSIILPFVVVGCLHILVDIFTHGGKHSGVLIDLRFGWPFFDLRPEVAWDYRIDVNRVVIWPMKPFELIVFISTTFLSFVLIILRTLR